MFEEFLNKVPKVEYLPAYDPAGYEGMKAILFEGASYAGKQSRFFAYVGFPEGASVQNRVPAVVLQHGGGGYAFPEWIKQWTARGYAAIAISNTGFMPVRPGIDNFYINESWTRDTCADWTLTPNNDTTEMAKGSLDTQWLYHAVISGILARNILLADERVNGSVGLSGISWGGVITSLTMGFQPDFAFFIPIYGCAYLGESKTWMENYFTPDTCRVWDASVGLKNVRAPILWLNWAEDNAFDIRTNSKSYMATSEHAVMAMRFEMGHSHDLGWLPPESYRFADWVLGRGSGLTGVSMPKQDGYSLELEIKVPEDAVEVKAVLHYTETPISYTNAEGNQTTLNFKFIHKDITADKTDVLIKTILPDSAKTYYIEILTGFQHEVCTTSTPLIEIE